MSSPAALAVHLRALTEDRLAGLVATRRDATIEPVPKTVDELAERLLHPSSMAAACALLTLPQLQVGEAAAALGEGCPAPGLMETSNSRRIHGHGGTTEVTGRTARARYTVGCQGEARRDPASSSGAIRRIADRLGVHPEVLRTWVTRAETDAGTRPGTTSSDAARIAELERESRELRRANQILKSAASFFAELDRPSR